MALKKLAPYRADDWTRKQAKAAKWKANTAQREAQHERKAKREACRSAPPIPRGSLLQGPWALARPHEWAKVRLLQGAAAEGRR